MAFFDHLYVLSLRQMAMTKLAITVCFDPEIMNFVKISGCASFVFPSKEAHLYLGVERPKKETWLWKDYLKETIQPDDGVTRMNILPFAKWEELVKERISALPKLLQHELLDVVRSVSIEIDKWIKGHSRYWTECSEFARSFHCDFQWNSLGKIDRLGTARKIIINKRSDTTTRFILTLLYGLTDMADMTSIQKKVPYEIVHKCSNFCVKEIINESSLIPDFGIQFKYITHKDIFITASSEEKVLFLIGVLREECLQYEDFLFFMSHLSDDERKSLYKHRAFKILRLYFLEWPLQYKFLNAAEQLLPYFTESNFRDILKLIIYERIMLNRKDFNYTDLLKEFWSLSPSKLKESIKTDSIYEPLLLIINFPDDEIFPSDQLLENYRGDGLIFTHDGIKYRLCRVEQIFGVKNYFKVDDTRFIFDLSYPTVPFKGELKYITWKTLFVCCEYFHS